MTSTSSNAFPPRRSLAVWAFLALTMVVLSYTVILLIAVACVYLPYLVLVNVSVGFQTIIVAMCGLAMAGTMLWSLIPKRDQFEPPGPLLTRSSHPRLFSELEQIAATLNETLPAEVYLIPEVNAFVADRGGTMGFGTRRVMGIGLPLLGVMTVAEFRAVLAHEFAHYYGGDTRLGPWVYRTRMAMVHTIQNMASLGGVMRVAIAQIVYRVVMWILQGYWKIFFRATQMVSRRQEFRADELACYIASPSALINGLTKLHGAAAAFPSYWNSDVLPLLSLDRRPAIAEGFEMFVNAPLVAKQIEQEVEKELIRAKTTVYDSHPPLRARIAAAQRLRQPEIVLDSQSARTLFGDLLSEEVRVLAMFNTDAKMASLKAVNWNEVGNILPRIWRELLRNNAEILGDFTADQMPEVLSKLPEIGSRIPDPKGMLLTRQQRTIRAVELFGLAVALAVSEAGWEVHMLPGEHYYQCGNERISVREMMSGLMAKKITAEEWRQRCHTLKITGVRLASLVDGTATPIAGQATSSS